MSLSFLVDDLVQHRGGAAANIGLRPGPAGPAARCWSAPWAATSTEYEAWLRGHGVDTASIHWSEIKHTARFTCTTDATNNQIASFYSGAMAEASEIELSPGGRPGGRTRPA